MQPTRFFLLSLAVLSSACEPIIHDIGETLLDEEGESLGESQGDGAESIGGTSGSSTEGSATSSPGTDEGPTSSSTGTDDGNPTSSTGTDDGNPTSSTGTDDGNPTSSTGTDDGNPTTSASGDDTTSTGTTGDPDDMELCLQTGGAWHEVACGHEVCGEPQICEIPSIPGCACGPTEVFVPNVGCVFDRLACEGSLQQLCEATAGVWDERSCGDYECDAAPNCDAVIPGCDCGPARSFDVMAGCFADASCGVSGEGQPCDAEANNCAEGLACCYPCGIEGCEHVCEPANELGECPPPPPSAE